MNMFTADKKNKVSNFSRVSDFGEFCRRIVAQSIKEDGTTPCWSYQDLHK